MHEMQTIVNDVCGVCLSVCHAAQIGAGAGSVRRVPCARGHLVQPSPNAFGLLSRLRKEHGFW